MGRSIPSSPTDTNHPILSLSLLALSVAACIAVVSTLCATCHPKPPSPSKTSPSSHHSKNSPDKENPDTKAVEAVMVYNADAADIQPQSPSTPSEKVVLDMATHGPIFPTTTETSPKRRLSTSLSMKLTDGLSRIRTKNERQSDAGEETIWMKTIILGEKCRVPSDDEEEVTKGGESGNRPQRNYHPKTPRSLPVSRTNSFSASSMTPT